jgi:predicted transcriptional regulator
LDENIAFVVNGLDILLNKAILQSIQNALDEEKMRQIEEHLQAQGFEMAEMLSRLGQIRRTLFEFEQDFKKIEDRILKDFLTTEENSSETWLVITNKALTELILKTFADEDKKMILDFTRNDSETIPKILSLCNLPNTSGYRKVKKLIDNGFVIPTGMAETFDGRRALLYKSIIQKIQIHINKNDIVAKILVPKEILASSIIVKAIGDVNEGKRIVAN